MLTTKNLIEELELAEIHSGVMLDRLEPSLAIRIEAAIHNVVNGILSGTVPSGITEQPYGDQPTVQEYLESLKDLKEILYRSRGD